MEEPVYHHFLVFGRREFGEVLRNCSGEFLLVDAGGHAKFKFTFVAFEGVGGDLIEVRLHKEVNVMSVHTQSRERG